ncbi:sucrase ferredoxin [Paenibacillus koleovorans]|uniref:sucrase ferredoxin n=1 Tax=Paenibacillus koleovorans TaxID=121608 RepID=UPI0013E40F45|nr:sucrase ferredoxin [Paenibacillus koleovorans]
MLIDPPSSQQACAAVSSSLREDLGGTASSHERYVLVEVPLPWEHDAAASKHFPAGLAAWLKAQVPSDVKYRLLAFASDFDPPSAGRTRLIFYKKPAAPFSSYERLAYSVPTEQAGLVIAAYLGPDSLDAFDAFRMDREGAGLTEWFVCTHGSHDACCGKLGYQAFRDMYVQHATGSEGTLRVWRVSHIGGHRMAATAIEFPAGRYWGRLTPEAVRSIVKREGDASAVAPHLRGWGGLGPQEQLVDRELLAAHGWGWLERPRSGTTRVEADGSFRVRLEVEAAAGKSPVAEVYEATVRQSHEVHIYGCEIAIPKAYPQYEVSSLQKL